ncbi:MAG: hypothetical protein R2912_09765 [Eubacteriales bacterium]
MDNHEVNHALLTKDMFRSDDSAHADADKMTRPSFDVLERRPQTL